MKTKSDLQALLRRARPLAEFAVGEEVEVYDKMQREYRYVRQCKPGDKATFANGFSPAYTPQEMIEMGIFEGKYLNDKVKSRTPQPVATRVSHASVGVRSLSSSVTTSPILVFSLVCRSSSFRGSGFRRGWTPARCLLRGRTNA
jgi:tRNA U34 5-methylaminomethyl-2-thiouridine-forming methyltransferase MnmC